MKKNTTTSFLILLSIIVVSSNLSAEETNTDIHVNLGAGPGSVITDIKVNGNREDGLKSPRGDMRDDIQASTTEMRKMREENKGEIQKIRADFQAEVRSMRSNKASSTKIIKEKRQALIAEIQEKRDLFKKEIDIKNDINASTTAAIKLRFKADLLKIKDQKKKEKVENIGGNLLELNSKLTTRATENVNKIEEVLIAIESRADKTTAAGANLGNVRVLIAIAETAIADARVAISVQTAKIYTVSVQSDATIKISMETTRNILKADIDSMNTKIKVAHDTTRKAAEALKANPRANATTTVEVTGSTTLHN